MADFADIDSVGVSCGEWLRACVQKNGCLSECSGTTGSRPVTEAEEGGGEVVVAMAMPRERAFKGCRPPFFIIGSMQIHGDQR